MADITTIARPYARAIFEHALAEKTLADWSQYLLALAYAVLTPEAATFITNPASAVEQQVALLKSIGTGKKEDKSFDNLVTLLAVNKRVMLLPEIAVLYEAYKAEQEKTLCVDVISFSDLSEAQQQKLMTSLGHRLQRKVALNISIDPSLIGGAILRAGDLVIDGSIRSRLNKLNANLAA